MKDCKALEKLLTISLESIYRKVQCMLYTHHLQQMVYHMATWCWNLCRNGQVDHSWEPKCTTTEICSTKWSSTVVQEWQSLDCWTPQEWWTTGFFEWGKEVTWRWHHWMGRLHIAWSSGFYPANNVKLCRVLALQPKQVYIYLTRQAWTWKTVSSPTQLTIILQVVFLAIFRLLFFLLTLEEGESVANIHPTRWSLCAKIFRW